MTPVRLEPTAPRSRVKHSTTEPLTLECTFTRGAKQKEMFEISDLRRETLHLRSVRLSTSDGGVKILNFNIFGDFQKTEYFWGLKILWIFLGVITKLDYI